MPYAKGWQSDTARSKGIHSWGSGDARKPGSSDGAESAKGTGSHFDACGIPKVGVDETLEQPAASFDEK